MTLVSVREVSLQNLNGSAGLSVKTLDLHNEHIQDLGVSTQFELIVTDINGGTRCYLAEHIKIYSRNLHTFGIYKSVCLSPDVRIMRF